MAVRRTQLANERTFLAYVRTALSLLAAGAALLHFFAQLSWAVILAWVLMVAGLLTLLAGLFRFVTVRGELTRPAERVPEESE